MRFYVLKRMAASVIDSLIVLLIIGLLRSALYEQGLNFSFSEKVDSIVYHFAYLAIPMFLMGILSGQFGWTPGKLLLSLRVHCENGSAPGLMKGVARELIKAVSFMAVFLGTIWALFGIFVDHRAFYDKWTKINVVEA